MSAAAIPNAVSSSRELAGDFRTGFAVAGISVAVSGDSPQLVELGSQLHAFAADILEPDIEVRVEWKDNLLPGSGSHLFDSGCVWNVYQRNHQFVFDFATKRFGGQPYKRLHVDSEFRQARVFLNRQCMTEDDAARGLEYPLDELLITHHLSLGRGVELHACGMVNEHGESCLFAGHSGAGKSTTARLWTRQCRVRVLSDDRIVVRNQDGKFLMHGTPWHGEAEYALPVCAPLQRIFLLEHGRENRIVPVSRAGAAGELLARSFTPFYSSRFVEPVLTVLESIAESVPCYRFQFVPDQSAVEKILAFND